MTSTAFFSATGISLDEPVPDALPGWVRIKRVVRMIAQAFFYSHHHPPRAENLADEIEAYLWISGIIIIYLMGEDGEWKEYILDAEHPFVVVRPGQKHAGHIAAGCTTAAFEVYTRADHLRLPEKMDGNIQLLSDAEQHPEIRRRVQDLQSGKFVFPNL